MSRTQYIPTLKPFMRSRDWRMTIESLCCVLLYRTTKTPKYTEITGDYIVVAGCIVLIII